VGPSRYFPPGLATLQRTASYSFQHVSTSALFIESFYANATMAHKEQVPNSRGYHVTRAYNEGFNLVCCIGYDKHFLLCLFLESFY
jgi:hypothetical protein